MLDIYAIEQRLKNSTPGPWAYENVGEKSNEWVLGLAWSEEGECLVLGSLPPGDAGLSEIIAQRREPLCEGAGNADAEFIAHAPTDIAALIQRVRHLEECLDDCEDISRP